MNYDLLTFGEAMLRLAAAPPLRLEQTRTLDVSVACTELTVAALLSRMHCSTTFVTRLANTPLGRMVNADARAHGVDTSWVKWTDDERSGLMFYEIGAEERPGKVIYDRKGSTASRLCIEAHARIRRLRAGIDEVLATVPGVFERLPGFLENEALLRIDIRRHLG